MRSTWMGWRAMVMALPFLMATARGEVLLQYFETEWDQIYQRIPEIAEIGYEGLWTPPPAKSPHAGGQFAGGGNVGYSHFDKFDLGDIPQRGSRATRYGTRGSLRNMVDNARRSHLKIYPDVVMNHNGNGPDFRTYPGQVPNDFHGWFDAGQPGGFKRAPRMFQWTPDNGYGGTLHQELVSLIDFQAESDNRFSTGSPNYSFPPAPFLRHPGRPDLYPYGPPSAENTIQFLNRWIAWLGYAMDFDGVRLDAPKHMTADFFGLPGQVGTFLHEIQYNFDARRGYTDYTNSATSFEQLYLNYQDRDDALIFSEFFIGGQSEVDYWRNFGGQGNKFRYLDFPRKSQLIGPAFGGGNLAALNNLTAGFSPAEGVMFAHSHDENPPGKLDLAYAYILTRIGLPVVFFTGNNLDGSEVNTKTWMKLGYGAALGDYNYNAIPNMVFVNNTFARGSEFNRWGEGDFFVFERYDDINLSTTPNIGEGLLLVGLNDSGAWQTRNGVQTSFDPFTPLKDYSINGGAPITVKGDSTVDLSIPPGNNGQSWVFYAPYIPEGDGDPMRFVQGGSPAPTMSWIVPGGRLAASKPRSVVRLTQDTVDINVHYTNQGPSVVDAVMVKWGLGQRMHPTNYFSPGVDNVSGKFQSANPVTVGGAGQAGHFRLTATITNMSEGLHLVQGRAFVGRPAGKPALFNTFREVVYVDRRGPDLHMPWPTDGATIGGSTVATVTNADKTAYYLEYSVNGGAYAPADEIQKGEWKFVIPALASGTHTVTVRALEADYGNPRGIINTSTLTRVFNSAASSVGLAFGAINRGVGANIELPFFRTIASAPGASSLKLYWDGWEMLTAGGVNGATNVFTGEYRSGGTTQWLRGAFVNGVHFFEAVAVSGSTTTRAAQRVVFNLYGQNAIDSDGDGVPDEVEMPNFFAGTSPGPNVPWPGDNSGSGNQDMIPNYGETWSRMNPMAHDTDYNGFWDDSEDWDGDGVPNGCEVRQGYLLHTNAWHFNIYNSGSKPTSCVETNGGGGGIIPAQASWTPTNPNQCPGSTLTITYAPNQGVLSNASPVQIYIGYNGFQAVTTNNMNNIGGGQWQFIYNVPGVATQVNFVFRNSAGTIWDNNGGADWNVNVGPCVVITNFFTMNGQFDGASSGAGYEVANTGMKILAAVKSNNLYVATWSANGGANDHFLYVTDQFGEPEPAPWAKGGNLFFTKASRPHLVAESAASGGYHAFNNSGAGGRAAMGNNGQALEGELNLAEVFGYIPERVYIAAVAYGDNDNDGIASQCPAVWNGGNDIEVMEFQAVDIESIRDENLDGHFDAGKPQLLSVVNGNTNDANYNIRRFFIDEVAGESASITFILNLNTAPGASITDVELFSNLNRRDFAVLPGDEDPTNVTTTSASTYYRAYAMSGSGSGPYTVTLPVNKCGAYRVNARYKVNGKQFYYTDHALRRDLAVVVTPKKALNITMYELNPLTAEATSDQFAGRSTFRDIYQADTGDGLDILSTNYFKQLGVNMLWLQPIHPIGFDNRETDPSTGQDYDPGSPYAVKNYWKVNPVLGDPYVADGSQAMTEFSDFVQAMDANGVGVMLDGTFNHSAWDAEIGQAAVDMFPWATNESSLIRDARPQWYSRKGNYGLQATYYQGDQNNDIATAPDRTDFGKWSDVADFFFGTYDALVQGQTDAWRDRYLLQEDRFDGFANAAVRELWEYFAHYPIYWLEQSGHPIGTPKTQSYKGIDGLRCDFAQGLPSEFWEYTINKTRAVKWDFVFMAESLDGFREINGNKRNGLSFRSARHFDVLNENLVFYWRDQFFDYKPFGGTPFSAANPTTFPTWQAFDNRRNAYDVSPILLNLTGHDELLPQDDQWRLIYAYGILSAVDGAPMLFAGQEAGLQNAANIYSNRGINPLNNYARYEVNFGKGIPHFKRYNHLTNVWNSVFSSWKTDMFEAYKRINRARLSSPALRAQSNYMLAGTNGWNPNIYGVAKFEQAGVPASSQDVVFAFVNNNYQQTTNRYDTYNVNVEVSPGVNWFGIQAGKTYNIVDLASPTPTNWIWSPSKTGTELLTQGLTVILNGNPYQGRQLQYLKLIDVNASYPDSDGDGIPDYSDPDDDNDGLPDWWEALHGPRDPASDDDGDGVSNEGEYAAGTHPGQIGSVLEITSLGMTGSTARISWDSVAEKNYRVEKSTQVHGAPWEQVFFGTAFGSSQAVDAAVSPTTMEVFRVLVKP